MNEHLKRAITIACAALIFVACVAFVTWGSSPADWTAEQRFWVVSAFILVTGFTAAYPGYGD